MVSGQRLFSMGLTTYRLQSGGAMDSSYLLSTFLFGLESEGFGGRPLACGEGVGKLCRYKIKHFFVIFALLEMQFFFFWLRQLLKSLFSILLSRNNIYWWLLWRTWVVYIPGHFRGDA